MPGTPLKTPPSIVFDTPTPEEVAAVEATHRQLSDFDWEWRLRALERPDWQRRSSFSVLDRPHRLLRYRLQSWPTFVDPATLEDLRHDSVAVNRLLRQIPRRLFDDDPERLTAFYRLGNPLLVEALLSEPTGLGNMATRGDFIATETGMKCIEMNFTPSLGGWDASVIAGLHWEAGLLPEVVRELPEPPRITDTLRVFLDTVLDTVESLPAAPEPPVQVVIISDWTEGRIMPREDPFFSGEMSDVCRQRGYDGRLRFAVADELDFHGGELVLDGERVHAVVSLCHRERLRQEIFWSFKGRRLALFNSPLQRILTDKRNLALLSLHEDAFEPEERAVIRRVVPWTRMVEDGEVDRDGEVVHLPGLLRAEQAELVLKRGLGAGGEAVVVGRHESADGWRQAVDRALEEGGWVVQEFLQSRPYLYQEGVEGCAVHDVIWGPFVFGDRYGGSILRMQAKSAGGPVNLSLAATEGVIYEL